MTDARSLMTLVSLILLVASLSGCSGGSGPAGAPHENTAASARPSADDLAGAPLWVTRGCRYHWTTDAERREVVCATGSAPAHRNRVAARDTAVARARASVARSIEVTIESLVRLENSSGNSDGGDLKAVVHQLSSASLPASEVIAVWRARSGSVHALVALQVARVQQSVRKSKAISPEAREGIARRAEAAFADLDQAFEDY